jgi:hypothetical protein
MEDTERAEKKKQIPHAQNTRVRDDKVSCGERLGWGNTG